MINMAYTKCQNKRVDINTRNLKICVEMYKYDVRCIIQDDSIVDILAIIM